jgi:sporulation protein YlmC with PRC-barrel domain
MIMATVHPNHAFISSEDVEGTNVYDMQGNSIGEIDHLMIDKVSGQVQYAVMSFGGFMGLGHSHYPVPWQKLSYDVKLNGYRTDVNEAQLRDAPEFSDDSWGSRDWEKDVHNYYGVPPYWGL